MTNENSANIDQRAATVRARLLALRKRRLTESIDLLREAFPEVMTDAERFLQGNYWMPWDFGVALTGGELGALRDKYDVPSGRGRPHHEDVPALTDMFCRACELLDELRLVQPEDSEKFTIAEVKGGEVHRRRQ